MNIKKVVVICLAGLIMTAVSPSVISPSFAAKGGVRMSVPKSLPAAPKTAPRNNSTVNNANRTTNNNANSAQANQQSRQNTQSNARTNTQSQSNPGSGWGSAMRNIGLLAGGMFLGSMLSSLFGWGGMGFMADILGVMFNIALLLIIISLISRLWSKFRGRKKNDFDDDAYRRGYEAAKREAQFHHSGPTIDVTPVDDDKDKRNRW